MRKCRISILVLMCYLLISCSIMCVIMSPSNAANKATSYKAVVCNNVSAPKLSGASVVITLDFSEKIADKQYADMEQRSLFAFKNYLPTGFKLTEGEMDMLYRGGLITADKPNSLLYSIQFGCLEYNNSRNVTSGGLLKITDTVGDIKLYTIEQIQLKAPTPSVFSVQIHYVMNSIQLFLKGGDPVANYNIAPKINQEMVLRLKSGFTFPTGVMLKEDITFKYYPELHEWQDITYGEYDSLQYTDDTISNQAGYTDKEIEHMEKA